MAEKKATKTTETKSTEKVKKVAAATKKTTKKVAKVAEVEAPVEKEINEEAPQVIETAETQAPEEEEKHIKAGPKARRAKEEAAEEVAKETKSESKEPSSTRGPSPKTRPHSERHSKKYKEAAKKVDLTKSYSLKEAVELAKATSVTKFDGTVELHVKLGVDPRHADQNIRATVSLPHGTGKSIMIAVFAPSDQHEAAKKAGADIVGEDDFLRLLDKEQIEFDVLIATPMLMSRLAKYAKLLGPRGLMPNPKSGTVSAKVAEAVKLAKAGRVEFRVDKLGIVHQSVGKVSFTAEQLQENAKAVVDTIQSAKPASVKGTYIQTVYVASTMGPGIRVDNSNL